MNVELPRPTYISSWDNVKNFFCCCARQPAGIAFFQKGTENLNFLNGSWEILLRQLRNAAAEGWPVRFLYERWELGNGKWEMGHRPITMDHRKV